MTEVEILNEKVDALHAAMDPFTPVALVLFQDTLNAWLKTRDAVLGLKRAMKTKYDLPNWRRAADGIQAIFDHDGREATLTEVSSGMVILELADFQKFTPAQFKDWLYESVVKLMFSRETMLLAGKDEIWMLNSAKAYCDVATNPEITKDKAFRFKIWETVFVP